MARASLEKLNSNTDPDGYPCLLGYWVLNGDQISQLDSNKWAIAAIATSQDWINQEIERLNSCIPGININISTTRAVKK